MEVIESGKEERPELGWIAWLGQPRHIFTDNCRMPWVALLYGALAALSPPLELREAMSPDDEESGRQIHADVSVKTRRPSASTRAMASSHVVP